MPKPGTKNCGKSRWADTVETVSLCVTLHTGEGREGQEEGEIFGKREVGNGLAGTYASPVLT